MLPALVEYISMYYKAELTHAVVPIHSVKCMPFDREESN